jgi:hypothetical protein
MERLAICKNYIDDLVKLSTYTCSEHLYGRVEQVCIKFRGFKNPHQQALVPVLVLHFM